MSNSLLNTCPCPEACLTETYDALLSFAIMPQASPMAFFRATKDSIRRKLEKASEIKLRVNTDTIVPLLDDIQAVIDSLRGYNKSILDKYDA